MRASQPDRRQPCLKPPPAPRARLRFRVTIRQLVTQARSAGFTLGIALDKPRGGGNRGAVIGFEKPGPDTLSGKQMAGVWFENRAAAMAHQQGMTRVEPRLAGLCATPARTILFVNGLQWKRYKRYDMTITGESVCVDSQDVYS